MLDFAVKEFNHYPNTLRASRVTPPYIKKNQAWPPKWVYKTGHEGPMTLNRHGFLRFIIVLYLLGVKKCGHRDLKDLYSNDPILGEKWLQRMCSRNDLQRFIRQVCVCVCVVFCASCCCTMQTCVCDPLPRGKQINFVDTRNFFCFFVIHPVGMYL